MKILSINDFTTKLLSDLYIGVHLKGTKNFANKVINRQFFHRKNVFHMKLLSITTKLLSIIRRGIVPYFLSESESESES